MDIKAAGVEPGRHLRLGVYDVCEPLQHMTPPEAAHVRRILEFGRGWDAQAPPCIPRPSGKSIRHSGPR